MDIIIIPWISQCVFNFCKNKYITHKHYLCLEQKYVINLKSICLISKYFNYYSLKNNFRLNLITDSSFKYCCNYITIKKTINIFYKIPKLKIFLVNICTTSGFHPIMGGLNHEDLYKDVTMLNFIEKNIVEIMDNLCDLLNIVKITNNKIYIYKPNLMYMIKIANNKSDINYTAKIDNYVDVIDMCS